MDGILSVRGRAKRRWTVAGLVLAAILPTFLELHVIAAAPGAHQSLITGLLAAEPLVAACAHGRFAHVEAGKAVKPCPACFLSTVQRLFQGSFLSFDTLPPSAVLTVASAPFGSFFAVPLRRPRGPPARS